MLADWIMVAITTIYVIATIVMCYFNYSSVKCAREQMAEMKRQNDAEKRWKMMPFIQVKKVEMADYTNAESFHFLWWREAGDKILSEKIKFEMENVGFGVAKEIKCVWERVEGTPPGYICSLPVGDKRIIEVLFHAYLFKETTYNTKAVLLVSYSDLVGNRYEQRIDIFFEVSEEKVKFLNTAIEAPRYIEDSQR